jgi:hypothetical protein
VCDECSQIAEKNIVCVFCNVCVHPVPACCRFLGDQLSHIDCYITRHNYTIPHAVPKQASKDLEAPLEPKDERKPAAVNKKADKANLKQPPTPIKEEDKEDDRKPAAVDKKAPKANLKQPPKPVKEEDEEDDRNPPTKEDDDAKNKRRHPKLPLHPSSTGDFRKLIGKSPHMDLDLQNTKTKSDDGS